MSNKELGDLFILRRHTRSDTYDCMYEEDEEDIAMPESGQSREGGVHQQQICKVQVDTYPC